MQGDGMIGLGVEDLPVDLFGLAQATFGMIAHGAFEVRRLSLAFLSAFLVAAFFGSVHSILPQSLDSRRNGPGDGLAYLLMIRQRRVGVMQ